MRFILYFILFLIVFSGQVLAAESSDGKWVLVNTSINPNKEMKEFEGGGSLDWWFPDKRYKGKTLKFTVEETTFTKEDNHKDSQGIQYIYGYIATFSKPPETLIEGEKINLTASVSGTGPPYGFTFSYKINGKMLAGSHTLSNSNTASEYTVPKPIKNRTIVISAEASPCAACRVEWKYKAEDSKTNITTSPAKTECNLQGRWSTQWGGNRAIMTLTQTGDQVYGSYTWKSGKISAVINGTDFTGKWYQGEDWGSFIFKMSDDCNSFSGSWGDGSSLSGGTWTGTRILKPPKRQTYDDSYNYCGWESAPQILKPRGALFSDVDFNYDCYEHDNCYEECLKDQITCDYEFETNMINNCGKTYESHIESCNSMDWLGSIFCNIRAGQSYSNCRMAAALYARIGRIGGSTGSYNCP